MKEAEKKPVVWKFTLGNGKKVTVTYYPRWHYCYTSELTYRFDHFEFRGAAVSVTGYRSVFATVDPNPDYDGTQDAYAFAKKKIVELTGIGLEDWEGQLSLF
ncbi:MAG TPA: hypothetical protein VEL31_12250 [Ktedonobacteraceae bacterium]|nr:hypothetical protein [Ktedonobacteraceae bacterium]